MKQLSCMNKYNKPFFDSNSTRVGRSWGRSQIFNDTSPHRIEVDIANHLQQIRGFFTKNWFACPACPVALADGTGVKCLCVWYWQSMDALRVIWENLIAATYLTGVPVLEQMSMALVATIELLSITCEQSSHDGGNRNHTSSKKMGVISYQRPRKTDSASVYKNLNRSIKFA